MKKSLKILTWQLRLFGFMKIPMIFFCRPSIVSISNNKIEIKINLDRRTKNHLGSMYFGVLSVGADLACGYLAMNLINKTQSKISLIFKDFHAYFLKRAEDDVLFICEQGFEIQKLVKSVEKTGDRQNLPINLIAVVPKISNEPIAKFVLALSLKKK